MKNLTTRSSSKNSRTGLTLVEVATSTVIISFLLLAALRTTANVYMTWSIAADNSEAHLLCQLMLSEILQKNYMDPEEPDDKYMGIDTGETSGDRTTYDDLDDYSNYSSTPPKDQNNTTIPGYDGWTQTVIITKVDKDDPTTEKGSSSGDSGIRKVTVMLTSPEGKTTTLMAIQSQYGQMQQQTGVDQTFVTWAESTLQIGSNTTQAGTHIMNHSRD